jgi:hypothetical protein
MKTNKFFKVHLKNRLLQLIFFVLTILIVPQFVSAQNPKASLKLGAYYFGGWSGRNYYDDGTPEHAWAKGMPITDPASIYIPADPGAGCDPCFYKTIMLDS